MKISYRTHPALKYFEDGFYDFLVLDIDMNHFKLRCKSGSNCHNIFQANIRQFKSNIKYLSRPFCEAINLSARKIVNHELIEKYYADKRIMGTILFDDYSIFYNLETAVIVIMKGRELLFFLKGGEDANEHITYFAESYYKEQHGVKYRYEKVLGFIFYQLFSILGFIDFCPIEAKELKANSKKNHIGCKYVNDTDLNIQYLDSKWFTTLVKSDAFKVRGHFRLQPCGEGLKARKLIWINEFEKEGYTAPARKLSNS